MGEVCLPALRKPTGFCLCLPRKYQIPPICGNLRRTRLLLGSQSPGIRGYLPDKINRAPRPSAEVHHFLTRQSIYRIEREGNVIAVQFLRSLFSSEKWVGHAERIPFYRMGSLAVYPRGKKRNIIFPGLT